MSNIRNVFTLNSIGCNKVVLLALEGNTTDRCMVITCSNLHTERFEAIFNQADEEQAHGATKNE